MRTGFSLVELMICIAIVGILSAIAVPRLNTMVLKARKAEATTNLRGIGDAELAYWNAQGTWVTAASNPGSPIGKNPRSWREGQAGWTQIG